MRGIARWVALGGGIACVLLGMGWNSTVAGHLSTGALTDPDEITRLTWSARLLIGAGVVGLFAAWLLGQRPDRRIGVALVAVSVPPVLLEPAALLAISPITIAGVLVLAARAPLR